MGDGRTQINLQVSESQKQDWENFVDEHEDASSLSHLIRLSVNREIERDDQPQTIESIPELSAIPDKIDALRDELDQISTNVQTLMDIQGSANIEELAEDLYDALPRITISNEAYQQAITTGELPAEVEMPDTPYESYETRAETPDDRQLAVYRTVEGFAELLNESQYRVRKAVDRVQDSFANVHSFHHDGRTYVHEVIHHD